MRTIRLAAVAGSALVLATASLSAQSAPNGLCRVWIDGMPSNRQPAPTTCDVARASAPRNSRIIYGSNTTNQRVYDSRGQVYDTRGQNGDWRYAAEQRRLEEQRRIERERLEAVRYERERELARVQRQREAEARLRREQMDRDRYRHASNDRNNDRYDHR